LTTFALFACAMIHGVDAQQLRVYPATDAFPRSADFDVRVRTSGGDWKDVPAYGVPVSTGIDVEANVRALAKGAAAAQLNRALTSMASFDCAGQVEVLVTWKHGAPKNVRVRPSALGIVPAVSGSTIHLFLDRPRKLSIEVDGDIFHNLQLFADSMETSRPSPGDPNVLYYGPGIHDVGTVEVASGTTVYLAGGAVVVGGFHVSHAHDVRIAGRGILTQRPPALPIASSGATTQSGVTAQSGVSAPAPAHTGGSRRHDAILIEFSTGVQVEGITEVPSSYTVLIGQSENITIKDLKSFSAGGNNDGIDVFTSKHVVIDDVFMRNSDDCIALYGHRWAYYGDLTDVGVTNSTLWADVAHPILVGTHGDTEHPAVLSHLQFRNIDILDQREPQVDYQGCMSLNAGDSNLIRDVLFEDIRVDDFRMGQLVNIRVMFNRKYNTSPGRGVEDVIFRNVSYTGRHADLSVIAGYDDERAVKRITFENLRINGIVIADDMPGKPGFYKTSDLAHMFVGEHVDGLVFTKGSSAPETR
jgi:hypothetical protein